MPEPAELWREMFVFAIGVTPSALNTCPASVAVGSGMRSSASVWPATTVPDTIPHVPPDTHAWNDTGPAGAVKSA